MRGAIGSASTTAMGVPDLGTEGREQIEYLPRTALVADEKNFYSLDGIDELAASIELIGVQQPLRVRPIEGEDGLYRIVSGHRRRAALDKLALEGSRDYEQVPCIVERDNVSPAMQELRLIYANADTRKISDADLAKQAERVTELLYQLKEEGLDFPGRMRDHVAEACKISKTKLATLKVIREKLPEQYRAEWESGNMSTDAAHKLASAPPELQARICKAYKKAPSARNVDKILEEHKRRNGCLWEPTLKCPDGSACKHGDAFLRHDAECYWGSSCGGKKCCLKCDRAIESYGPCNNMCSKAKAMRTEKLGEEKAKQEKLKETQQKKYQKAVSAIFNRFVPLIDAAGLDDDDNLPVRYSYIKVGKARKYAAGDFEGATFYSDADYKFEYAQGCTVVKLAQLLHCSTDFILGLTDDPTPHYGKREA